MFLYILIFVFVLSLNYVSISSVKMQNKMLLISISLLALFVGFGDMLGGFDRYVYGFYFDELADVLRRGGHVTESLIWDSYRSEFGYVLANYLITFVTANRYIFIFILTIIIYFLLYKSFKLYIDDYPIGLVIFMGMLFFFTFTYLRQVIGVMLAWLSVKAVYERKLRRFLLFIFLAFSMHNSAIIFLPVYWIPIKKFSRNTVYVVMVICLVLGLTGLPGNLFDVYGDVSGDAERLAHYADIDESGFRVAYIMEAVVFLFFIMRNYRLIQNDPKRIVLLNISLMFCAILLVFVKSENGGRLAWYYMIGIISTLTYLTTLTRQRIYHTSVITLMCILFMRILLQWNMLIYPYKTFLTNGHRDGDRTYEANEYDTRYDNDKFYR